MMQDEDIELAAFSRIPRYARIAALVAMGALPPSARDHIATQAVDEALRKAAASPEGMATLNAAAQAHVQDDIRPGDVYEYDASSPHLISPGYAAWSPVTVIWSDGSDVHYRRDSDGKVDQTPLSRFLEIVRPVAKQTDTLD